MPTLFVTLLFAIFSFAEGSDASALGLTVPQFADIDVNRARDGIVQNPVQIEAPVDSTYLVGPGDYFEIITPLHSEVVQVGPEGSLSIAGAGLVQISGMPLYQAKLSITELVRQNNPGKRIDIQLVQLKRTRVNLLGALNTVGQTMMDGGTRLSNAMRIAGGLLVVADKERIQLIRRGDTTHIDFSRFDAGDMACDPILESGDIIWVPYLDMSSVVVLRTTVGSMAIPYKKGMTLNYYIQQGNFHRMREPGYSEVKISDATGLLRIIPIDSARRYVPNAGEDLEFLFKKQYVYVGGAIAAMGRLDYAPSWNALDYLAASGITIVTGSLKRVTLIRNGERASIDVATHQILPGDYIEIPRSYYESVKDLTLFLASLLSVVATALIIRNY